MTSSCCVWWCSNMIFMAISFPKLKKRPSWKKSSVSKEETVTVCVHSHGWNHTKQILWCKNQANELQLPPHGNQRKHWANDNALELNAIGYTFSKIFQPEQLVRWAWTPCLHLFGLPSEEKLKKKLSWLWKISLSWWNKMDQIVDKARLFWKSIVKTKDQNLTSLAFVQLVVGADRVVRHVCLGCLVF